MICLSGNAIVMYVTSDWEISLEDTHPPPSIITPETRFHCLLSWFIVNFDFDFGKVETLIGEHHNMSF